VFGVKEKRRLICTLLNGMSEHSNNYMMMRFGCSTFLHFKIPDDVVSVTDWLTCSVILLCLDKLF
jgi:hypothetical protein